MSPHTAEQAMSFHRLDLAHLSEIAGLQVEESQLPFFAPTEEIVAEAIRNPDRIPMAIRVDGVLVGFFVFHKDRRRGRTWWLAWFMLDKRQQGKGYGKAAFRRIVRLLATRPQCERVRLQVTPGNDGARSIYVRAGFEDTDEAIDGDDVLELSPRRCPRQLPVASGIAAGMAGSDGPAGSPPWLRKRLSSGVRHRRCIWRERLRPPGRRRLGDQVMSSWPHKGQLESSFRTASFNAGNSASMTLHTKVASMPPR
jgi:diamine N-acetyltransferase